jgi:hypothetical protein
MADENEIGPGDNGMMEFVTYEDYLDSQITPVDLFYLEVRIINPGQGTSATISRIGV